MPIRPENKIRYPKDWKAISLRIREWAGQRCEKCRAPNGEVICRGSSSGDRGSYMVPTGEIYDDQTGEYIGLGRGSEYPGRYVKVVLTVAHLDHTPENCADDNLKAWCQRCHNIYDMPMRKAGIAERARLQLAAGDLFGGVK